MHWHVEDGLSAFIPPGGQQVDPQTGVHHVVCEIEVRTRADQMQGSPPRANPAPASHTAAVLEAAHSAVALRPTGMPFRCSRAACGPDYHNPRALHAASQLPT